MAFKKALIFLALTLSASVPAFAKNAAQGNYKDNATPWSRIKRPIAHTPPQAVGGYANGCQLGAQELPLTHEAASLRRVVVYGYMT